MSWGFFFPYVWIASRTDDMNLDSVLPMRRRLEIGCDRIIPIHKIQNRCLNLWEGIARPGVNPHTRIDIFLRTMPLRKAPRIHPLILWTERLLALLVAFNYALALFDLSYVPWRNFWLHGTLQIANQPIQLPLPPITTFYDRFKGITPNRFTTDYLNRVNTLEQDLRDPEAGPSSPKVRQDLEILRNLSREMVDENPFAVAGKSGTLERIKNRVRDRYEAESAKVAFAQLWSPTTLTPQRWPEELAFFNEKIRPLIETNYYRTIGENGEWRDRFWRLDLPFQIFFGLELLIRIYRIRRRHPSLSWREALLWRWYDLLLLLPFLRWLRIIPLSLRLQSARLIDLEPLRSQISRGFISVFAGELLEVIAVQSINQAQQSIRRGDLKSLLNLSQTPYVDLNDTNEIEVLARRLSELLVYQVLPRVQPDLEALLQHNLLYTLQRLPAYQLLQNLPGFSFVPQQLTQQLASGVSQAITTVSQGTYSTLTLPDPNGADLMEQLVRHFTVAFTDALSDHNTLQEIQTLLCDLLEEFKFNYVSRISEADFEAVLEEAQQLSRQAGFPPTVESLSQRRNN